MLRRTVVIHRVAKPAAFPRQRAPQEGVEPLQAFINSLSPRLSFAATAAEQRASLPEVDVLSSSSIIAVRGTSVTLPTGVTVSTESLWSGAHLVRSFAGARRVFQSCVVSSEAVVRRLWQVEGLRPRCVFARDTSPLPEWCKHACATIVIRAPQGEINDAFSNDADCDGFAAEFDIPPLRPANELAAEDSPGRPMLDKIRRVLVQPTDNCRERYVGTVLAAAARCGYDAAILIGGNDVFSEAVVRHSEGLSLCPHRLRICRVPGTEEGSRLLQRIAAIHCLVPFFVCRHGDASVETLHEAAQRHAYSNYMKPSSTGAMVILPSESEGGIGHPQWLVDSWTSPAKAVKLDTSDLFSLTAPGVIGPVAIHSFRSAAELSFRRRFQAGLVPDDAFASTTPTNSATIADTTAASLSLFPGSSETDVGFDEAAHPALTPGMLGDGTTDGDDESAYLRATGDSAMNEDDEESRDEVHFEEQAIGSSRPVPVSEFE